MSNDTNHVSNKQVKNENAFLVSLNDTSLDIFSHIIEDRYIWDNELRCSNKDSYEWNICKPCLPNVRRELFDTRIYRTPTDRFREFFYPHEQLIIRSLNEKNDSNDDYLKFLYEPCCCCGNGQQADEIGYALELAWSDINSDDIKHTIQLYLPNCLFNIVYSYMNHKFDNLIENISDNTEYPLVTLASISTNRYMEYIGYEIK